MRNSLRLRVFAGPNGSGKSTVIRSVAEHIVDGHPIDFGVYVNADDIARKLVDGKLLITDFGMPVLDLEWLIATASKSGLFSYAIDEKQFQRSIRLENNQIILLEHGKVEAIAQIFANGIREILSAEYKKFSFETVFSHPSKVEFMQRCQSLGYKVYLYFVGTANPEINKFRVKFRVSQGGHNVPEDRIVDRYYRSMDLLWEATRHCYQVYFFDNSHEGNRPQLFASYKIVDGAKLWNRMSDAEIPNWFIKYYLAKAKAET